MTSYGSIPTPLSPDSGSDVAKSVAPSSGCRTPPPKSEPHICDPDPITPLFPDDQRSRMSDDSDSHQSAQAGVRRLEAISSTWSRIGLYMAYVGIALLAYATSLEGQTTVNLTIYATSAFKAHSLVSTVLVVQGVVLSVVKPPMSKIADVFGRFEAFSLSVFVYIIGYVQQAAASDVSTYAAAQIFYSAGQTGLQILIQIFIADTSDLVNRALCSTIPDIPYLANVWIGPALADTILHNLSWRWGYGIWAVVLPAAFTPLALALVLNQRKAALRGIMPPSPFAGKSGWQVVKSLCIELDLFGLLLICSAFSLVLIPLTLAAKAGWNNPNIASMLVIGAVCLFAIPFWERSKTLAPRAFFPRSFWRNRTLLAGLGLSFFYFMAFYLSVYPYFQSYLLIVQDLSLTSAGRIVQTFTFTSTITSIIVSFLIKYTKRYKQFMIVGTLLYLLGLALMMRYRTQESSITTIIATQIFLGVGGSLTHVPAQLGVQASASHSEVAAATALFLTFLEIGGAVGSAISGAIWTSNIPTKLALYLPPESAAFAPDIYGNISLAANGWPVGSPTRIAINRAYQETMTRILSVAVCVAVPCILLALLMSDYKLDEIDQGVKGVVIGGEQELATPAAALVNNTPDEEAGPSSAPTTSLRRPESRDSQAEAERDFEENEDDRDDSRTRLLGNGKKSRDYA